MDAQYVEKVVQSLHQGRSDVSLGEKLEGHYRELRLLWKGKEYVLHLYVPDGSREHFDIGLSQLEKLSQHLDPEHQNLFYWHVTSLLRSINEQCDKLLRQPEHAAEA